MMIHLRIPDELTDRIDKARGDITRTRWITRALEQALAGPNIATPTGQYRQHVPGPDVTRLRSSQQAKAGITPIPKTRKAAR